MKKPVLILVLISLIIGVVVLRGLYRPRDSSIERPNYEAVGKLKRVIDGDTVVVKIQKILDPHEGIELGKSKVRLAGIDTEETSQSEAARKREKVLNMSQSDYEKTIYYKRALEAKRLLKSLFSDNKRVFLDIDDLAQREGSYQGSYGRLIAVIYLKRGSYWLNVNARVVNKEYLKGGEDQYPISTKFNSEFDPYDWLENDCQYL